MSQQQAPDDEAAARHAQFGVLPERIRIEDMIEEQPTTRPNPGPDFKDFEDRLLPHPR